MRVLLFATSLDVGGAERVLLRLARGLLPRGYEVEAASLLPPGKVAESLRAEGVPVHALGGRSKLAAPAALARLRRLLAGGRFDLVSSFLFHANVIARLAAPPRLVTSVRIIERARPWRQAIERLAARRPARVVCVCDAVRRALARDDDPRFVTIRNGVPIPPEPAARAAGAPWISVGRLDRQKGHDVLIDAWRLLGAEAPPLHLAGAGPIEGALRARAAGLPIEFLGERAGVEALLAAAGGFVLASRDEGLPNALLEAMAAGLPVVATAVGGIPEAVASGGEGLLIPPGDPRALAEAVRALARDPARAAALGAAARARARREFSVDGMVARWDAVYHAIFSGRGGSTS